MNISAYLPQARELLDMEFQSAFELVQRNFHYVKSSKMYHCYLQPSSQYEISDWRYLRDMDLGYVME